MQSNQTATHAQGTTPAQPAVNVALIAQLGAAQTLGAQQAIFAQVVGTTREAKIRHPHDTNSAHESRRCYEMANWQAFTQSITTGKIYVVFESEWMGHKGNYAAIDADAFNVEWGEILCAYSHGTRIERAALLPIRFEIAERAAADKLPGARYVDLHPEEADLHRFVQCQLFDTIAKARLDRTDKNGRLRASFAITGRYVSSWSELTPSEMVKLLRAIAAGIFSIGWIYQPTNCLN
jgi:hypothetical protein